MIDKFRGNYWYLSNFAVCRNGVYLIGSPQLKYPTVENAYQAAKTLIITERKELMYCSPAEAKRRGRSFKLRSDWESVKLEIMEQLLQQKFSDQWFGTLLLSTGEHELVEGNTWEDTYWGVCDGVGENHLGKLLMKVRSELRSVIEEAKRVIAESEEE